ncbi:hypothetical protein EC973_007058 [Apophysomyces ossiformis]|uniref:Endoglycoceramidase n=1 Tax=Apophysomyces ossiformis TaxID=679940 RepID=A0A8H7EKM8_9FUNG|nr:hypothetical protein EC973_007058 [Apophysomyces ossiformis]
MLLSTALISTLFLLGLQQVQADQDPSAWYKAHPGMARIKQVNQSTHQIVDVYGRTRFFHGTNVVMKQAPWYRPFDFAPGNSFGPQDVQNLHDLGINIVRLGHHWAGAEPIRGQYNQTFMDIMKKQTKLAEEQGIYVLVDVHQDVLAGQFCGHGVPNWFVQKGWVPKLEMYPFPLKLKSFPVDDNGMPSPSSICDTVDWALSYTSVAVCNAFGRLYNNYDGLGDAFASYWKMLASQYVNTANIVGYNLLNEPWVGDTYADPTLLVPGVADHKVMEGLWNRASKQIRTVDNNTLIWFEGSTYDILSGFNNVPLGDGSKTLGSISDTIQNRQKDNQRLKTASVLTELTFWMGDQKQMNQLNDAMEATDKYMVSWIGWAYENLYDRATGKPYPDLAVHYSRAYPTAVAGTPTSYSFDESSATFTLTYKVDTTIDAPTEIMLPARTFPNGYNVNISPANSVVSYTVDNRTLALFVTNSTKNGDAISITITKK